MKEYEYDLFLSCSGKDLEFAKRLRTRLQKEYKKDRLLKVFLFEGERGERPDLPLGQNYILELEKALSASWLFGYVLSPASVESPSWTLNEYTAFLHMTSMDPDRYILPLLRRDCTPPLFVRPIQRIDFRKDARFEDGVTELLSVLRGSQPVFMPIARERDEENLGKLRKEVLKGLDSLALRGKLELFVVRDLYDDGIYWERLRGKEQYEKVPHLFDIYNRSGKDGLKKLWDQLKLYTQL